MARYVIDPPTLLAIARGDVRVDPGHQLVAPNAIRSQALEILLGEVRSGALSEKEALALHTRLTEIKLRLLGDRVSRRCAWDIAREQDWPQLREAEYLALVGLQADALVSVDPQFARLASALVPVAAVTDLAVA